MFGTAREALAELINTVRSNAKSAPWETHPTVTLDRKWLVEFLEKTEKLS